VSYDNPTLPSPLVIYKYTPYVQYLYVTNDIRRPIPCMICRDPPKFTNPWDTIPPYLENLVAALQKLSFLTAPPVDEDDTRGRIPEEA
jgi:hypothetical protein